MAATQMWRVVSAFRVITLAYAALLIVRNDHAYAHPGAGLLVLAVMTAWSAVTVVAYRWPAGRSPWLLAADVGVAVTLVISTRWIDTPARINHGWPTLPVAWAAASVIACAVAGGRWWGLAAGIAVSAADVIERGTILVTSTFNSIVLVLIAGGIGGWVVELARRAESRAERVARREAALAERERLARDIHDSVLQVLALVSSRGQALGGEAAEIGRLAGEQEAALRALLASGPAGPRATGADGQLDLRALLASFGGIRVTVSCPATAVLLPENKAEALAGATAAALDNVRRHAGPDARAWVLVEDEGAHVQVSVRDNGSGFAATRLAEAAADGRLGVPHSIVGRLRTVGGTASVDSSPGQGTEVELRVART
jgi:signal transduction histidine kinase